MKRHQGFRNGLSLYVLQAFRVLFPFVTVPYITRVLGPEGYGEFAAGLNLTGYLTVLVVYGFDLTGVRAISLARDPATHSQVYSEITSTKILLCGVALCAAGLVVLTGALPVAVGQVLLVLSIMVVASALQQVWVFQGLQRAQYILIGNVVGQALSLVLIFSLVRASDDLVLYAACYAAASLIGALLSIVFVRTRLNLHWSWPGWAAIRNRLREGFPTFVTSFLSVLLAGFGLTYMTLSGVEASELGLFAATYKITALMTALVWGLMGFCICLAGPWLLPLVFGVDFSGGEKILYPLVIWAVVSVVNNGLGVQVLVSSGHGREYAQVFIIGAAAVLVLTPPLVQTWGPMGAGLAALGAECALLVGNGWQVVRLSRIG